mgnify:CR=1 FL=1
MVQKGNRKQRRNSVSRSDDDCISTISGITTVTILLGSWTFPSRATASWAAIPFSVMYMGKRTGGKRSICSRSSPERDKMEHRSRNSLLGTEIHVRRSSSSFPRTRPGACTPSKYPQPTKTSGSLKVITFFTLPPKSSAQTYPDNILNECAGILPEITDEDMALIGSPIDFIGLNIYQGRYVILFRNRTGRSGRRYKTYLYAGYLFAQHAHSLAVGFEDVMSDMEQFLFSQKVFNFLEQAYARRHGKNKSGGSQVLQRSYRRTAEIRH